MANEKIREEIREEINHIIDADTGLTDCLQNIINWCWKILNEPKRQE